MTPTPPPPPTAPESFGLPTTTPRLQAKLRTLQANDPALFATIRNRKVEE